MRSAPPTDRASRTDRASQTRHRASGRSRTLSRSAFGWSLLTLVAGASWSADVIAHPFGDPAGAGFGAVLDVVAPRTAGLLVASLGGVGLLVTALLRRRPRATSTTGPTTSSPATSRPTMSGPPHRPSGAVSVTAAMLGLLAATVLVDGRLLVLLGYTPVVATLGWFHDGLFSAFVDAVSRPHVLLHIHGVVGTVLWGGVAVRAARERRGACVRCGRTPGWTHACEERRRGGALRVGRIAVAVASVFALAYPALRLPWLVGWHPGISASAWHQLRSTPGAVATGVLLGLAGLVGAAMMTGLVRDWGARWPRWLPGVGGRRLPVLVAVLPAALVAVAMVSLGRGLVFTMAIEGPPGPLDSAWIHALALAATLPWGLALAVATAVYAVRRTGPCHRCGRGEVERTASDLRALSEPTTRANPARARLSSDRVYGGRWSDGQGRVRRIHNNARSGRQHWPSRAPARSVGLLAFWRQARVITLPNRMR